MLLWLFLLFIILYFSILLHKYFILSKTSFYKCKHNFHFKYYLNTFKYGKYSIWNIVLLLHISASRGHHQARIKWGNHHTARPHASTLPCPYISEIMAHTSLILQLVTACRIPEISSRTTLILKFVFLKFIFPLQCNNFLLHFA
jgi:hypothetical protein